MVSVWSKLIQITTDWCETVIDESKWEKIGCAAH